MNEFLIGYARVYTADHDLTAQRLALAELGVDPARIADELPLKGVKLSIGGRGPEVIMHRQRRSGMSCFERTF